MVKVRVGLIARIATFLLNSPSPDLPTLRIRVLRPAEVLASGRVLRFLFRIRNASAQGVGSITNKVVLMLWMENTLVKTTLDEVLGSTVVRKPAKYRGNASQWAESFAGIAGHGRGPVLLKSTHDAGYLSVEWLYLTQQAPCRQWKAARQVGPAVDAALGDALLLELRNEIGKGQVGQAVSWADLYDLLVDGE